MITRVETAYHCRAKTSETFERIFTEEFKNEVGSSEEILKAV